MGDMGQGADRRWRRLTAAELARTAAELQLTVSAYRI
jgi:hypothetical protein